jgi:catechol 2,3-dioxygenase-like lactoylglutathione lyase family enzyme
MPINPSKIFRIFKTMLFSAFDHPAIACLDAKRQIEWYCATLGMKIIATDGKTPPSALLGYDDNMHGGTKLEMMPARDSGQKPETFARFQPGLRHLALRVDNFDQAYNRLKSLGVEFLFEPNDGALGGGKIVSFRDPEGNELQIVERK